jgi:L-ascorbate metabolism protein UlaG (beta-lactamase superfamily)
MATIGYVGHSTVEIELDGVRLLTDPLLRKRVAHLRRAVPLGAVPHPDAVLISHGHYDHLDPASLRLLPG